VKKQPLDELNIQRPQTRRETHGAPRLQNVQAMKQQLLEEIIELESKMGQLKGSGDPIDLSLIQTYREMIHGRRKFFAELDR
jgi:hypothetical protein